MLGRSGCITFEKRKIDMPTDLVHHIGIAVPAEAIYRAISAD